MKGLVGRWEPHFAILSAFAHRSLASSRVASCLLHSDGTKLWTVDLTRGVIWTINTRNGSATVLTGDLDNPTAPVDDPSDHTLVRIPQAFGLAIGTRRADPLD